MLRLLALSLGILLICRLLWEFRPSLYGFVFGLFFLYLPFLQRIPVNLAPGVNLVTLFLVALVVIRSSSGGAAPGPRGIAFRNLLLVWLGVGVVGFCNGLGGPTEPTDLFVMFKRWLDPLLFSLLALRLVRREDQQFTLACILVGYALVSIQGAREGLDIGDKQRIAGLIGQANELGAFLATYAPLVLVSALLLTKNVVRLVLLGFLILGVTALVYTESRASLLALPLGVCVMLCASGRGRYGFIGLLLVLAVAAFPNLLPEKATERFEGTYAETLPGTGVQLDRSAASRLIVWKGALEMIAEHPLGVGFAQFQQEIPNYAQTHEYALDAHNYYLSAWAEFSFIGLVVLLLLLYRMLADAWALARHGPDHFLRSVGLGLWAAILATLFVNCFGTRLMEIQVSTYLWVLTAVAAAARDTVPQQDTEIVPVAEPLRVNAWGLRSYS